MGELILFLAECCFVVFIISGAAVAYMLHGSEHAPQWVEEDEFYRERWYK